MGRMTGFLFPGGGEFFSSPLRPDRLWGPRSLLSTEHRRLFPGNKTAGEWNSPFASI